MTLSKSRFAVALECPRQLDYARDDSYYDARREDEFLRSLAEGGHQVGELARRLFPEGHLIEDRLGEDQEKRTAGLLMSSEVTLFEATIRYRNLLIRTDILDKKDNHFALIEVKAKGFDPNQDTFLTDNGANPVRSTWRSYLYDVAYQTYVMRLAYPGSDITPYLMLLDKTVTVHIDGLNSIKAANDLDVASLPPILRRIPVADEVNRLLDHSVDVQGRTLSFAEFVEWASDRLGTAQSFPVFVGAHCKDCPFYVDPNEITATKKSGWAECMEVHTGGAVRVRRPDTVFGLHRVSEKTVDALLAKGNLALKTLPASALDDGDASANVINLAQRRHLQVAEAHGEVDSPVVLHGTLRAAIDAWQWPLHFIDFETSRPALPYHRGRRPYDQILFQFSHHVMHAGGHVEHRTECLETNPGVAPSIVVLRALRNALTDDEGSVVHWWTHEDTVLKDIRAQIILDKPTDAKELIAFVDSLVGINKKPGRLRDLGQLVSRTVFYPGTAGSSSIKKVLPAALRHSQALRDRYSAPLYGTLEMPSHNFKDRAWVKVKDGTVQDPYALLQAESDNGIAEKQGDFIADGGAAIIAYDHLQRAGLATADRQRITHELLRYCELDTLAMVMVCQSLTGHGLGTPS
jgi:hypothetical protein